MELEGPLLCQQEPLISPYSKSNEPNPNPTTTYKGDYETNITMNHEKQGTEMWIWNQ